MNQHVAIITLEIKLDPDKKESDRFPIGFMASQGHQIASLLQSNVVDPATGRQVPDFAEILPAISDLTLDILTYCLYIPVSPVSSRTACLSKNPGFQLKNLYFFKRAVLLRWDLLCNDNELDRCIHNTSHTIMEHVPSLLVLYYISYILLW
jgi:hypothetical protein